MLDHRINQLVDSLWIVLTALWRLGQTTVAAVVNHSRFAPGNCEAQAWMDSSTPNFAPDSTHFRCGRKLQAIPVPTRTGRFDPGVSQRR